MSTQENTNKPKLELIKASDIEPKEIEWLWYPFIPFGKVTLVQGDPSDGKSYIHADRRSFAHSWRAVAVFG